VNIINPGLTPAQMSSATRSTPTVQQSVPTAGATVVMTGGSADAMVELQPAGTLATLTVTLPDNATSIIGDIARIGSTKAITLLTINGAATIIGNVTAMIASQVVNFKKVADNTWMAI